MAKEEGLSHKLLIIGSKEKFRSKDNTIIKKIENTKDVSFSGFIAVEALIQELAEASLLVQPSLYEGFCLPPLEAMSLGTQALISDIEVLKEVYKDFPVSFFRAGDKEDLKNKLLDILLGKPLKSVSLSDVLLNKYTFQKTALSILDNIS
jgi:glycosyltransferase involved in cell wall biosynthesis